MEPEYGERWDVFPALPQNVHSILDVGCGTGMGFQSLRRQGIRLCGVDIEPELVEQAATRMDEAIVLDIEKGEWPRHWLGAFDVVAFCDCLEHLVDPWKVLERVHPLLSPQGVVVASIPNVRQWRIVVKLALGIWDYQLGAGTVQRFHVRFFTRSTVQAMFQEAGYDASFFWPTQTFHLRGPERLAHRLTLGAIPDLLYGSYTVQARPHPRP